MKDVRRSLLVLLITLCVAVPTAPAFAQTDTTQPALAGAPADSVVDEGDLTCAQPGVVRPNCGVKPQQAGDRGGVLQYTVWVVLIIGLIVVFSVVFRSAARTNRKKTAEAADRNWN